MTIIYR